MERSIFELSGGEKQSIAIPCDAFHRLGLYLGTSAITVITAFMALDCKIEIPMALMLIVYSYVMFNTIEAANTSLHVLEMLGTAAEKLQSIEDAEFIDKKRTHDMSLGLEKDVCRRWKNSP